MVSFFSKVAGLQLLKPEEVLLSNVSKLQNILLMNSLTKAVSEHSC